MLCKKISFPWYPRPAPLFIVRDHLSEARNNWIVVRLGRPICATSITHYIGTVKENQKLREQVSGLCLFT